MQRLIPWLAFALIGLATYLFYPQVPLPAPSAYQATHLASGEKVALHDLRGKPVLLASWATWCAECKDEFPGLEALWQTKRAAGLMVIAVNVDGPGNSRPIRAQIEQYGLTMPVWRDAANHYAATFQALGVPTTVLLDRQGQVRKTWSGAVDFQSVEISAAINAVLTSGE